MIYAYRCPKCEDQFDVIKSVSLFDRIENCPGCNTESVREFVPRRSFFIGTKVEHAEYNPGLGCIVKNSQHRNEIAKSRGLIEIGSEPVASIHKIYDQKREESREKAWNDVDKGWVGDGSS